MLALEASAGSVPAKNPHAGEVVRTPATSCWIPSPRACWCSPLSVRLRRAAVSPISDLIKGADRLWDGVGRVW